MGEIKTYAQPTWIYRYRSLRTDRTTGRACPKQLEREIGSLLAGKIYCPQYTKMNDPMEGFYRASSLIRDHAQYSAFITDVRDEKLQLGIASFSEAWDNELMWAHYADEFRGICVVYKVQRLLNCLGDEHALARIAYGDRPYYLNLHGLHREDRARAILSTKNLKWSHEREWRLFAKQAGEAQIDLSVIPTIFLGMRMAVEDRAAIQQAFADTHINLRSIEIEGYTIKRVEPEDPAG